jgi:uncharacterized protein YbjT (DUF2867 family)
MRPRVRTIARRRVNTPDTGQVYKNFGRGSIRRVPHVRSVVIAGGTGYIGSRLAARLIARGHAVRVLARAASTGRIPSGAVPAIGDPLDPDSYAAAVRGGDTIVHLVGTPHPSPAKAAEFRRVDLPSIEAAVAAATRAGAAHLVYVSVAHPAPVMAAYIAVRTAGEAAIAHAGLTATVLRPWYVLGPGHWWPALLLPLYWYANVFPSTKATAQRLGLVTIAQMLNALVAAVESPPAPGQIRIVDIPAIRRASLSTEAVNV